MIIRQSAVLQTTAQVVVKPPEGQLETGSSGGNAEKVPEFLKDCWVPGKEKQLWSDYIHVGYNGFQW